MSIPTDIAWLIPIVLPFIIGLLVGAIIKRGFKLLMLVIVLIVVLIATGILTLTFGDFFTQAMSILPKLYDVGVAWLNVLPYSAITFIIGVVLGFIYT